MKIEQMLPSAVIVVLASSLFLTAPSFAGNSKKGNPPPPLPPLTMIGAVETNRHPFGVAIDSTRAHALVANRDSKTASLVDLLTLTEIWEITVGRGPFGAAVNPVTNVGVITLEHESAVAIINLATKAVTKVGVPGHPFGVAIDPGFNLAVVAVRQDTIAFIDLATKTLVSELPLGKFPYGVAVNPNTHVAAVTNQADGSVTLIDYTFVNNPTVAAIVALPGAKISGKDDPLRPHSRPAGIAFDYAGTSLNRLVVADPGTGNLVIVTLNAQSQPVTVRNLGPLPDKPHKPVDVAVNPGADFGIVTSDHSGIFAIQLTNPAFTGRYYPPKKKNDPKKPQNVAIDPVGCRAAVTNRGLDYGKDKLKGNVLVLGVSCSPVITAIKPPAVRAGTTVTITITGSGLLPGTLVNINGTIYESSPAGVGAITVQIVAPSPGTYQVSVTSGGKTSNSLPLVTTALEPPVLCSVSPNNVLADGNDLTLTLLARNVIAPATPVFGGTLGNTLTLQNPVQILSIAPDTTNACRVGASLSQRITVKILGYPVTTLTSHGSIPDPTVHVINPDGGPSNALPVALRNPVPFLSRVQPNTAPTSTNDKILTLFGSYFTLDRTTVEGAEIFTTQTQVLFNGHIVGTVEPDPLEPTSKLLATIPASYLTVPPGQTAITYNVSVLNPGPGGGMYPDPNNPPSCTTPPCELPTFTVVGGITPSGMTVNSLSVGTAAPTVVALLKDADGVVRTGVAGIGNQAVLRLIDLTNPANPTLVPNPIVDLGSPAPDGLGDIVTLPGAQKAIAVTQPDIDQVVVVNFSVNDPLLGGPKIDRYDLQGRGPRALAVDATHGKLVAVNQVDLTLQVFNIVQPPVAGAGVALVPAVLPGAPTGAIDLVPALRFSEADENGDSFLISVLSYVAVNPTTGMAYVLDSPDPPDTGAVISVNYLNGTLGTAYPVGFSPARIAINATTNEALITEPPDERFRVLRLADGSTRAVVAVVPPLSHGGPQGVAVDSLTNKAVIVNTADNYLIRVDLNPATPVTSKFQIGTEFAQGPINIVWDPARGIVLSSTLINSGSTSVIVVGGVTPAQIP